MNWIPVHGVRGGIKAALAHQSFSFEAWDGSELSKRVNLHVTVEKKS